jgi:hypothetical protein
VLAYALFAVVGAVVALLGQPGYGWSLCALNVFLGGFHGLRYLSLRKRDEEWDDE